MSKAKSAVTENELLQRRTLHAQFLSGLVADAQSIAAQTIAAYSELLEDALLDVAVEAAREARTGPLAEPLPAPPPLLPPSVRPLTNDWPPPTTPNGKPAPLRDVFGQVHPGTAKDEIMCNECGRKLQAGVYARHLQQCLGLGREIKRLRR